MKLNSLRASTQIGILLIIGYVLLWPVPIDPQPWKPPVDLGFQGDFAPNERLQSLEYLDINGNTGPEAVVSDQHGTVYFSTHEGWIVKIKDSKADNWVNTNGRPLGMAFAANGQLIVADAYRGLLAVNPNGSVELLTDAVAGSAILYANDVDVTADGKIYFTDASTKFGAKQWGGTYPASLLDLMEHGYHGRVLEYDMDTRETRVLFSGLSFANGLAADPQGQFLLINETGGYRVHKYWLAGTQAGQSEVVLDNLPGFPDNIASGDHGRFWLGIASPRSKILDKLSQRPFIRKVLQRMPAFIRPKAVAYSHVVAINSAGKVVASLQDPAGHYPVTTGAAEVDGYLYISSLTASVLARIPLAELEL